MSSTGLIPPGDLRTSGPNPYLVFSVFLVAVFSLFLVLLFLTISQFFFLSIVLISVFPYLNFHCLIFLLSCFLSHFLISVCPYSIFLISVCSYLSFFLLQFLFVSLFLISIFSQLNFSYFIICRWTSKVIL